MAEIRIVISGSFRKYLNEIGIAIDGFNKSGIKVIAPLTKEVLNANDSFVLLATDDPKKSADILEKDFMDNITKSDFLYVANVDGYIGQSMATEMGIAIINNIPIIVAEDLKVFSNEIPEKIQELFKKYVYRKLAVKKISLGEISKLNLESFTQLKPSSKEIALLLSLVSRLLETLKSVNI